MSMRHQIHEHVAISFYSLRWTLLALPLGAAVGSACALFLWSLELATQTQHRWQQLLFLLPLAGVVIGWIYHSLGRSVEGGNNLIMDEIHEPGGGVPLRMAPLVLLSTIITHLFGGSAGREGTAVQMGGSIASGLAKWIPGLDRNDIRKLLMAGIAAGFGGVFGTPVAGTIFAMEVLFIGRMTYGALLPCLIASVVSDQTCVWWGIGHTHYRVASLLTETPLSNSAPFETRLWLVAAACGAVFGLASALFAELTHGLHSAFKTWIPNVLLRPFCGGLAIIGLVWIVGSRDYLGLGVTSPDPQAVTIVSSFQSGGATTWSWLWKLLFTAITLSSGFKGGEVTPLFFIGAALGNTLSRLFGVPTDLFAALGFASVFAGATNTPIACTVMAIELFGGEFTLYFATSCLMAYLFSGHSGIYLSQRIGTPKVHSHTWHPDVSLRESRAARGRSAKSPEEAATARSPVPPASTNGGDPMPFDGQVRSTEIGQLNIYLPLGVRSQERGLRRILFARRLYQDIIDWAKAEGIANASMEVTRYGFTLGAPVEADDQEIPNPRLTTHITLIDERGRLEEFCRAHSAALQPHLMVFRQLEKWEIEQHLNVSSVG